MLEITALHAHNLREKEAKRGLLSHLANLADPYGAGPLRAHICAGTRTAVLSQPMRFGPRLRRDWGSPLTAAWAQPLPHLLLPGSHLAGIGTCRRACRS